MVTKEVIIVESRFNEIFEYLPEITNKDNIGFKPTFMYGNNKQLLDYLRQNRSIESVYPLIWLIYPYNEIHERSFVTLENVSIVLAVETNSSMLNEQRLKETYAKVLFPLFDNIKKAIGIANIISTDEKYSLVKFPNYSEEPNSEKNATTYVWDALKITFNCKITSNCLKPIKF